MPPAIIICQRVCSVWTIRSLGRRTTGILHEIMVVILICREVQVAGALIEICHGNGTSLECQGLIESGSLVPLSDRRHGTTRELVAAAADIASSPRPFLSQFAIVVNGIPPLLSRLSAAAEEEREKDVAERISPSFAAP